MNIYIYKKISISGSTGRGRGCVSKQATFTCALRRDNTLSERHAEVEGHELHNRPEPLVGSTCCEAREAGLCDGGVNHALAAKVIKESLRDLVRALVLCHLLANDKDVLITPHFLEEAAVNRFTHG